MVDKTTIDRSINEALGKQKIQELHEEQKDNFEGHKEEIVEAVEAVEEHGKANKLLNILQVAEIAANIGRDNKVREEAEAAKIDREEVKRHNEGAKNSRSRIEGGIKDIKDMLGGDQPKVTQTEKLQTMFDAMRSGEGLGINREQFDANNIMASFAKNFEDTDSIERIANELDIEKQAAKNNDIKESRKELLSALKTVAQASKKGEAVSNEDKQLLKDAAGRFGLDVDIESQANWRQKIGATPYQTENDFDIEKVQKGFKGFRNMVREDRLLVPDMENRGVIGGGQITGKKGRTGVDVETIPEKNNEVLVDIYELLLKWYDEYIPGGGGGPGGVIPVNRRPTNTGSRNPNSTAARSGGNAGRAGTNLSGTPRSGFATAAEAGKGSVRAGNGRWYPAQSTQGQAIINSGNKVKTYKGPSATSQFFTNTKVGKGLKFGGPVVSAALEGYDAYADIQQIEERKNLGEHDEAYLSEEDAARERTGEIVESTARFATGTIAAGLVGTGLAMSTTGVGAVVGVPLALLGAGLAYWGASEGAEALVQEGRNQADDDLQSAKESGVYEYRRYGSSNIQGQDQIEKEENLKTLSSGELQAIIRHNDLEDEDKLLVQRELERRGGSTSSQQTIERIESNTLPTGDAVDNTNNDLEDAIADDLAAQNVTINNNNNSINDNSTKTEMGSGSLNSNDSRDSTWDSLLNRNYVMSTRNLA